VASGRKGEIPEELDENEEQREKWKEIGIDIPRSQIPVKYWTPQMWKEVREEGRANVLAGYCTEVDPYE